MGKKDNRKRPHAGTPSPFIVESEMRERPTLRPSWLVQNAAGVVVDAAPIHQDPIPAYATIRSREDFLVQNASGEVVYAAATAAASIPEETVPVSCYKTCLSDTVILKFDHPCSFILCGHVCINPLLGAVDVFGSHIIESTVIYSSKGFNTFSLSTSVDGKSSLEDLKNRFSSEDILSPEEFELFFASLDVNKHVLLMVSAVWTPPLFHAKQYLKFDLKPVTRDSYSLVRQLKTTSKCAIDIVPSKRYPSFQVPFAWTNLAINSRTVVVGGKSTGKSTLCKYLVNRLLNENQSVLYIECDIGQGEFSPPGCVAAYLLTEPVLGPSFFHQRSPLVLLFLGEVDASRCHSNYLLAVQYVINEVALPKYSCIPWVVNTMGFCQGLGVHLNYRVIQTVEPTTVIQLHSNEHKRNFKLSLTPERVSDQVQLSYNLILLDSVFSDTKKMTGRAERELKLLSHLSPVLTPPHYSFNEAQPYVIPFSELYIGISANIAACDVLRLLNCALVALCEQPKPSDSVLFAPKDPEEWFKIVIKPAVQPCVELGLVRGIDVENKEVHVVAAVPLERLEKVRMLVLGSVDVPPVVMKAQEGTTGPLPYTVTRTDSRSLMPIRRVHRHRDSRAS